MDNLSQRSKDEEGWGPLVVRHKIEEPKYISIFNLVFYTLTNVEQRNGIVLKSSK